MMNYFKRIGMHNIFMLFICLIILIVAEYMFLTGNEIHAIFLGLWVPTILGLMIFLKLIENGSK